MKNIKVLMSGCKCSQRFYELVVKTVNEHGIDARVEKVDDIMEVMQYNTMTLPALVASRAEYLRSPTATWSFWIGTRGILASTSGVSSRWIMCGT